MNVSIQATDKNNFGNFTVFDDGTIELEFNEDFGRHSKVVSMKKNKEDTIKFLETALKILKD